MEAFSADFSLPASGGVNPPEASLIVLERLDPFPEGISWNRYNALSTKECPIQPGHSFVERVSDRIW